MENKTQLIRYKKLLSYIDEKYKEEINIKKVEEICFYSYRNINRIFQALHHETIGKYIKRIRLEKGAQYLKFSDSNVSEIALDVGFSDVAAFSKAFKHKFNCSPITFRTSNNIIHDITRKAIEKEDDNDSITLDFELEILPDFEILYLEYRGDYEDNKAIEKIWYQLLIYVYKIGLLSDETIFLAEILDDNEITESVHCRYNAAIILENPLGFELDGLFNTKMIKQHKYAKFIHIGPHEQSDDTYTKIFSNWLTNIPLELADQPMLEFFLNDEDDTAPEDLLTEIYIPVL